MILPTNIGLKDIIPKGNIAILIISSSISAAGNIALAFLPVYFTSLGGTVLQYGIITAFAMLIGMPMTILGGILVQRHSLKKIVILTSWFGIALLAGYYFSHSWITLSIPIILGALGALGSTASRLLVADGTIQKNRTAQLSLYQTLTSLPSIVTPLVGGYLVHTMGTIDGFRFGILIALAISPVSTLVMMKFLREYKTNQSTANEEVKPVSFQMIKPSNPRLVFSSYFREFYNNLISLPKPLIPLLAAYVLVIVANSATNPYLIFYATSIAKINSFQWGIVLSLQLFAATILRTPLGMLSDRLDKKKVLLLSIMMTAPFATLFVFQSSFLGILGILLAMTITGINYGPTHESLQIEITPREKRPALFAIYDVLNNLARSSGIIIGAALYTVSYVLPFYGFTIMESCAGVILVLAFLRNAGKRRSVSLAT